MYFKVLNALPFEAETAQEIVFDRGTVLGGEVYDLLPSSLSPSVELIKSSERSLDGSLNVDITAVKTSLSLGFDYLEDKDFTLVESIFDLEHQAKKYPDGIKIVYFDVRKSNEEKDICCFIDDFSYIPFVHDGKVDWRDVTVKLVEI